jgi:hypothetical protein
MFANMKNYKIIKIRNLQFDKLQVHILKFTSLQITKFKIINCMCSFVNFKFTKLPLSLQNKKY